MFGIIEQNKRKGRQQIKTADYLFKKIITAKFVPHNHQESNLTRWGIAKHNI